MTLVTLLCKGLVLSDVIDLQLCFFFGRHAEFDHGSQCPQCPDTKLGRIMRLEKVIQNNLTIISVFGTRIGPNLVNLFDSHAKRIHTVDVRNPDVRISAFFSSVRL